MCLKKGLSNPKTGLLSGQMSVANTFNYRNAKHISEILSSLLTFSQRFPIEPPFSPTGASLWLGLRPNGESLRTYYHLSMPYASCGGKRRHSPPFPPTKMEMLNEVVLDEILEERVVSSRGRCNPRGVKRKMSKWPIRHTGAECPAHREPRYDISVLK